MLVVLGLLEVQERLISKILVEEMEKPKRRELRISVKSDLPGICKAPPESGLAKDEFDNLKTYVLQVCW